MEEVSEELSYHTSMRSYYHFSPFAFDLFESLVLYQEIHFNFLLVTTFSLSLVTRKKLPLYSRPLFFFFSFFLFLIPYLITIIPTPLAKERKIYLIRLVSLFGDPINDAFTYRKVLRYTPISSVVFLTFVMTICVE